MHASRSALFLVLALLLASGCTNAVYRFTYMSTDRDLALEKYDVKMLAGKSESSGEDYQSIIFVIPTDGPPALDQAVASALQAGGGNLMVDAVAERSTFYIPLIYGRDTWTVRGKVVKLPSTNIPAAKR